MSDKKQQQQQAANAVADALCSPPSHPTTLGNVWVGEMRPSPAALAEVLTLAASQKTRNE